MRRSPDPERLPWTKGAAAEEAAVLAAVSESRRLRQILRDLETIFLEEGFLHLSVSDIASRLRCSNMTLYRLAEGRIELFELIVELWLARARDRGRAYFEAAETWPDRLIVFLAAGVAEARRTSFAFMRDLQAFPGGRKALLTHQQKRAADLEWIIEAGVRAGAFHDLNPQLAADILLLSMRRFIEPEFLAKVHLDIADAMDEVYRLIEHGLIRSAERDAKRGRKRLGSAMLLDGSREAAVSSSRRAPARPRVAAEDPAEGKRRRGRRRGAKPRR